MRRARYPDGSEGVVQWAWRDRLVPASSEFSLHLVMKCVEAFSTLWPSIYPF